MSKTSLKELKYESCKAGGQFAVARDVKYRGFLYLVKDNEPPEKMLKEFDTFKKVIDGKIKVRILP